MRKNTVAGTALRAITRNSHSRQIGSFGCTERTSTSRPRKIADLHRVVFHAAGVQVFQGAGDVRALHEAVAQQHAMDAGRQLRHLGAAFGGSSPARPRCSTVTNRTLLVQHLVVLQVVQQGRRHVCPGLPVRNTAMPGTRSVRDCGSRLRNEASGRLSCFQRASIRSRPRFHDVISAIKRHPDHQRHPATLRHLQQVGG